MPRWWLVHAFVAGAVYGMLRLGLWQWHRAESPTGGLQNYAYAVQWPMFATFGVVLWVRTLIEEVRRDRVAAEGVTAGDSGSTASGEGPDRVVRFGRAAVVPKATIVRQPGVRVGVSTPEVTVDADDEEMQAYNARLAALNARAERARRPQPSGGR
jgi:hypothetical protein